MRIGDTSRGHLELIAEDDQDERLLRLLEAAITEGGQIVCGGRVLRIGREQPRRGLAGAASELEGQPGYRSCHARPRAAEAACDVTAADLRDIDGVE